MFSNEMLEQFHSFLKYNNQTLDIIENALGLSRRKLISDITNINYFLKKARADIISVDDNTIKMPSIDFDDLFTKENKLINEYVFQEERPYVLLVYLFIKNDFISNYHFQELFKMSKNSVLRDIKNTNLLIEEYDVEIKYTRKEGYFLDGEEIDIRNALEFAISNLLKFKASKWIIVYICNQFNYKMPVDLVRSTFLNNTNYKFVDERLWDVIYLISILTLVNRREKIIYTIEEKKEIHSIGGFEIIDGLVEIFPNLEDEKYFVATRIISAIQGSYSNTDKEVVDLMEKIISKVKGHTGVDFPNTDQFRANLLNHLIPAIYRLKYGIRLINPVKEEIKRDYNILFYLTQKSLEPLKLFVNKEINDDEIAYFTMHFGGYLTLNDYKGQEKYRALVVCPNGISSSLIISEQIRNFMPEIDIVGIYSSKDFKNKNIYYDMVFATTHIEDTKKVYIVKTIMNPIEKTYLKRKVYNDFNIRNKETETIDDLLNIIGQNAEVKNSEVLRLELTKYFMNKSKIKITEVQKGLEELLIEDLVSIEDGADDWKDAIRISSRKLKENGYIEESYIEDIIKSVEQVGPYIVLAPYVAVPHAKPNGNVNKLGIGLTKFKKSVNFRNEEENEDNPVNIMFTLAALDSTSHLKALQQLAIILDSEETVEELMKLETEREMLNLINNKIKEEL